MKSLGFVVPRRVALSWLFDQPAHDDESADVLLTLAFVTPTTYQKAQRLSANPVP